jgi:hypothetical protein
MKVEALCSQKAGFIARHWALQITCNPDTDKSEKGHSHWFYPRLLHGIFRRKKPLLLATETRVE